MSSGSTYGSGSTIGASSVLLLGRKLSSFLAMRIAWASSSATKWLTPEIAMWVSAPPSASWVTFSPVTCSMTFGPVMNMWALRVWMTKSVSAGEYAAPPAHGPQMIETCGTAPESLTFA